MRVIFHSVFCNSEIGLASKGSQFPIFKMLWPLYKIPARGQTVFIRAPYRRL